MFSESSTTKINLKRLGRFPTVRHGLFTFTGTYVAAQPLPEPNSDIEALDGLEEDVLARFSPQQQVPPDSIIVHETGAYNEVSTRLWLRPRPDIHLTYAQVHLLIQDLTNILGHEWAAVAGRDSEVMILRDGDLIMTVSYGVLPIRRIDLPTEGALTLEGYFYTTRPLPFDIVVDALNAHIDGITLQISTSGDGEVADPASKRIAWQGIEVDFFLSSVEHSRWPVFHQSDVRSALVALKAYFVAHRTASLVTLDVGVNQGGSLLIVGYIQIVDTRSYLQGALAANVTASQTQRANLTVDDINQPFGTVVAVS